MTDITSADIHWLSHYYEQKCFLKHTAAIIDPYQLWLGDKTTPVH